jgi:hypothetical protein
LRNPPPLHRDKFENVRQPARRFYGSGGGQKMAECPSKSIMAKSSDMTGDARFIEDLTSLFEAMLGDVARANQRLTPDLVLEFMAELAARGRTDEANSVKEAGPEDRTAVRAAFLDGGLDGSARRQFETMLAASPADLQEAIASLSFLDDVEGHRATAPTDQVDAAIAIWEQDRTTAPPPAAILPFRRNGLNPATAAAGTSVPTFDSFQLLAAASGTDHPAILCRSQSGLWTLEVFVETSERDQNSDQGYLLLSVHPDHRATYEGRSARVFVMIGNEERVLAEAPVRDGEIYTAISLAGLDLWTRDAVNVVFNQDRPTS